MKRMTYFVMALALVLGFTQCKKEQIEPQNQGEQVRITLNVNNGGKATDGSKVNVTENHVNFEAGDQILVASNGRYVGSLTASKSGDDIIFSGNITGAVEGEPLYFYFLGNKDTGTLTAGASGSTSCTVDISDQTSELPVISFSESNRVYDGEGVYSASLHNKASLIKFNVTTTPDSPICLTGMFNQVTVSFADLSVNDGFSYGHAGNIWMKGKDSENVTWAIVLPQADLTGAGEAYTTGYSGTWDKAAVNLTDANQYIIGDGSGITLTVNSEENSKTLDLSKVSKNETVADGWTIINTLSGKYKISIADGATVMLDGATINSGNGADYAGLTCVGDATIMLADGTTNTIVGGLDGDGYSNWPGIFIPAGSTLTINGNTGVLNARRGGDDVEDGSPAGIGASWKNPCGNIVINGGVINAEGGAQAAGIGGCCWRGCGDITINGGTVTATGHIYGTGIGLGGTHNANSITSLSGGNITITGGTVIATGGEGGAGIGTGFSDHKSGNTMTITLGNILISGGTVTATGGFEGAGIGTGLSYDVNSNSCGDITITGGTVTATGGYRAAGIGAGYQNGSAVNQCGDITITSGVTRVTATKGDVADNSIGHGRNSTCGTVTIEDGANVTQN